jgi:hypothetical protein
MSISVVIGLSAVVVAIRDGEAVVLTVRPHDAITDVASPLSGLPFGPFDPEAHRTFELGLRAFVTAQTRFQLGYVEQLYTFGDKGRDAPRAEVGAGAARVVSVGYLGLTPKAVDTDAPDTAWAPWSRFFPWGTGASAAPPCSMRLSLPPFAAGLATTPASGRARASPSPSTARRGTRSAFWSATSCCMRPASRPRPRATARAPTARTRPSPKRCRRRSASR